MAYMGNNGATRVAGCGSQLGFLDLDNLFGTGVSTDVLKDKVGDVRALIDSARGGRDEKDKAARKVAESRLAKQRKEKRQMKKAMAASDAASADYRKKVGLTFGAVALVVVGAMIISKKRR